MKKRSLLSRRLFIQSMAGIGTGLMGLVWYRLSMYQEARENRLEFTHGEDIPMGVSYFGSYYLIRSENGIRAFSTICTHAGCRIGKPKGSLLLCSCHGSQFDAETGTPLKGPAIRALQQYDCQFNSDTGQWVIKIQAVSESKAKSVQG